MKYSQIQMILLYIILAIMLYMQKLDYFSITLFSFVFGAFTFYLESNNH